MSQQQAQASEALNRQFQAIFGAAPSKPLDFQEDDAKEGGDDRPV